ncbi:hypothetical protein F6Y02_02325 [Bacillus megaterium]|nr:hypothetical protein [Priestia megaterium]
MSKVCRYNEGKQKIDKETSRQNEKILPVLLMLSLLIMFTCCAAVKPVQAAETEPMVSVKLKII